MIVVEEGNIMQRSLVSFVTVAAATGLTRVFLAEPADANSLSFSWVMNKRQVHGKNNGRYHTLDAGELTLSGKVWITDKKASAASIPLSLTIKVLKENSERDAVCAITVVPDTTINNRKDYLKSCGRIESGKYWILINKDGADNPDGDGWHNQGFGSVSTS